MTWNTGQILITAWVLAVIVMMIVLVAGCTKRVEKPECDAQCQEMKDSIQRVFNSKKIS